MRIFNKICYWKKRTAALILYGLTEKGNMDLKEYIFTT